MLAALVDFSELDAAYDRIDLELCEGVHVVAREAATEGAAEARAVGPFQDRSGALRRGILAHELTSTERESVWEIVSPAKYSLFVEAGTRPHVIEARNAVALRFEVHGDVVFARRVNHPGTKPYPFMAPALLKAEQVAYRQVDLLAARVQHLLE